MMDTSYWKTDDPTWMAARQEKWPDVEEWLRTRYKDAELGVDLAVDVHQKFYYYGVLTDYLNIDVMFILHPEKDLTILRDFIGISGMSRQAGINYFADYGFKSMEWLQPLVEKKSSAVKKLQILF